MGEREGGVGRFWTFCIFPKVARVRTFRKRGAAGGSILDFLRIFERNASFLIFERSEEEAECVGRFRTFCAFPRKTRVC